jgi:hypothetical protein
MDMLDVMRKTMTWHMIRYEGLRVKTIYILKVSIKVIIVTRHEKPVMSQHFPRPFPASSA